MVQQDQRFHRPPSVPFHQDEDSMSEDIDDETVYAELHIVDKEMTCEVEFTWDFSALTKEEKKKAISGWISLLTAQLEYEESKP